MIKIDRRITALEGLGYIAYSDDIEPYEIDLYPLTRMQRAELRILKGLRKVANFFKDAVLLIQFYFFLFLDERRERKWKRRMMK